MNETTKTIAIGIFRFLSRIIRENFTDKEMYSIFAVTHKIESHVIASENQELPII